MQLAFNLHLGIIDFEIELTLRWTKHAQWHKQTMATNIYTYIFSHLIHTQSYRSRMTLRIEQVFFVSFFIRSRSQVNILHRERKFMAPFIFVQTQRALNYLNVQSE